MNDDLKSLADYIKERQRNAFLICGIASIVMVLCAAVSAWFSLALSLTFIASTFLGIIGLLLVLSLHVTTKIAAVTERTGWRMYQQVAASQQLVTLVEPRLPFPNTGPGAATPDMLLLLCQAILVKKPHVVVESGAGVSTLVQGYLLEKLGAGKLYTFEHDPVWAERVRNWVVEHELTPYVTIVHAPLSVQSVNGRQLEWYDEQIVSALLQTLPPIDLIFVDGPPGVNKDARSPALPILRGHLAPHAEIILDDANRPFEKEAAQEWARELAYDLEFFNNERGTGWLKPRQHK